MRRCACLVAMSVAAAPLGAQSAAEHTAAGDSAHTALQPDVALRHYEAAIALDPAGYEALWKAARSIADVAKQLQGEADSLVASRDSLYAAGHAYAERAVAANPEGADGHYTLAMVLGRLSRTKGSRERVRFARVIYDEAMRALEIDSTHDGAHHVLGAWHAEVRRLSGVQRLFARVRFGAGFMSRANWDAAVVHLERAVALRPDHVYHRLELAEIYADLRRYGDARRILESIPSLPIADVLDPQYKQDAAALLDEIRDRRDRA